MKIALVILCLALIILGLYDVAAPRMRKLRRHGGGSAGRQAHPGPQDAPTPRGDRHGYR